MAQIGQPLGNGLTVSSSHQIWLGDEAPFIELDGEFRFFSFRHQVRQQGFENLDTLLSAHLRHVRWTPIDGLGTFPVLTPGRADGSRHAECVYQHLDRPRIRHTQLDRQNIRWRSMPRRKRCGTFDGYTSFTVKQASKVSKCRFFHTSSVYSSNKTSKGTIADGSMEVQSLSAKNRVNCWDISKACPHNVAGNGKRDGLKTACYETISSQAPWKQGEGSTTRARSLRPTLAMAVKPHECAARKG
jgi:hypothetical protein